MCICELCSTYVSTSYYVYTCPLGCCETRLPCCEGRVERNCDPQLPAAQLSLVYRRTVCVHTYVRTYVRMCVHMELCLLTYLSLHFSRQLCALIHIHSYTQACIYTHECMDVIWCCSLCASVCVRVCMCVPWGTNQCMYDPR